MEDVEEEQYGPFQLVRRIGAGGMAVTFVAHERLAGIGGERVVALKQILPSYVRDESFRKMFLDEARLATQLNHQNICKVYNAGEIDGRLYMSMEFVDGVDVWRMMTRAESLGRFPLPHALYVAIQTLNGLHAAHTATSAAGEALQLVHRDVSPQNVLVSRHGEVKVIDFGVAKAKSNMVETQAGMVKGKVLYLSPEQLDCQDLDGRSDLFAMGLMLYELAVGEHPLRGENEIATIFNYTRKEIPPPHEVDPSIPQPVSDAIMRALEKDVEQRYASADAMARALSDVLFQTYPGYQSYLLADFVEWVLLDDESATYTLPQSKPVSGSPLPSAGYAEPQSAGRAAPKTGQRIAPTTGQRRRRATMIETPVPRHLQQHAAQVAAPYGPPATPPPFASQPQIAPPVLQPAPTPAGPYPVPASSGPYPQVSHHSGLQHPPVTQHSGLRPLPKTQRSRMGGVWIALLVVATVVSLGCLWVLFFAIIST